MNLAAWFMGLQIVTCVIGGVGFLLAGKPWVAWTWFWYGGANIGFVQLARGYQ